MLVGELQRILETKTNRLIITSDFVPVMVNVLGRLIQRFA
jgi:hypothetical protein